MDSTVALERMLAVVDAALTDGWLTSFDMLAEANKHRVLATHVAAVKAFAKAVGVELNRVETEDEPNLMFTGWLTGPFAPGGHDDGKLRCCVGRGIATGEQRDTTLVANVRDLWLPDELQRGGYGACLINGFVPLWRALGVEKVRAHTVSEAGRAAFTSWGYAPVPPDENGHVAFSRGLADFDAS